MNNLSDILRISPVIAAVKEEESFDIALTSSCRIIFLLMGNICTLEEVIKRSQMADKSIYIHIDLIEGVGKDKYALSYIKERFMPTGIITTKAPLIKIAKDLNMTVIQRIFLIDNLSLKTGIQTIRQVKPDAVEILPGIIPTVTKKICQTMSIPIITGGLINDKKDIENSLKAGAVGVSTSSPKLWAI